MIRVTGTDPLDDETFLIALHELVEAKLCQKRGITHAAIDKFDMEYWPAVSPRAVDAEPGDDPQAPYRKEHRFSALIEHLMAHELGIAGYGRVE